MPRIVLLNGSPSTRSSTEALLIHVADDLRMHGYDTTLLNLRSLPAEALLHARSDQPQLAAALAEVQTADALVVGTPVYQASYSGLLKTFCDVLPVGVLRGVPVLPLLTGGSDCHILALDHGLKPLLSTLGATAIAAGRFINSTHISARAGVISPGAAAEVSGATTGFLTELDRHLTLPVRVPVG